MNVDGHDGLMDNCGPSYGAAPQTPFCDAGQALCSAAGQVHRGDSRPEAGA